MEKGTTFSNALWAQNEHRFNKICALPFIVEQKDGTLLAERYRHYIVQDTLFLEGFSSAIALAASKATDHPRGHERALLLLSHGIAILDTELDLHDGILRRLGLVSRADVHLNFEPSPACHHYVSFLLSTASQETLPVIVASMLPCYWLYREVANWMLTERQKSASSNCSQYQEWLDMYCSNEYAEAVDEMLALADELADEADERTRKKMEAAFGRAFQLEWMFWKSAYGMEEWGI
uniref:TENA_THI-4 domain-containing protein n=1 Tax=Globodera pallida TaxID=36090 RepID=A0A183CC09_GLOPA